MNICAVEAFVTSSSWSWTAVEAADKERNNFWPTSVISEQMVRTAIRFHKQLTLLVIDGFCVRGHLRTRRGHQANNINKTSVWRQAFSNRHSMVALLKRCTTFLSGTFFSLGKLSTHAICRCYLLNPSTSCDCLFPWWCALASKLVCHATKSRQDFALHRILSDLL